MKRKRKRRCKEIRREEAIRGRGEEGTYCTCGVGKKKRILEEERRKQGGKE